MATRLGLDPRVWQLCEGINKEKKRTVYFHNIISKISFHTLPPDEYNKKYSDEELECAVPTENGNGFVANKRIVLLSMYSYRLAWI
jgi:hypothetical protein